MIVDFLRALRGGVAFLTRLPTGTASDDDWRALTKTPAAFPVVGVGLGLLAALPLLASEILPAPTVAFGYLVGVYLLTGVHHLDGAADLGDAVVVHGDRERRRAVLKDTTTGVGGLLAVALVVAGLGLGALALAGLPVAVAFTVAVAAEVGAKLGMAAMAALATASHEGFGSRFTEPASPRSVVAPLGLSIVAVLSVAVLATAAAPPWADSRSRLVLVALATLAGALVGAAAPWRWARRSLGGVSGDVFGASNELSRVAGVHAGVIAWTLS
nr:adenosylcobinamide-GDP ribazoletransferase [Halovivax limisalsi]